MRRGRKKEKLHKYNKILGKGLKAKYVTWL